jgi:hypothetical protein
VADPFSDNARLGFAKYSRRKKLLVDRAAIALGVANLDVAQTWSAPRDDLRFSGSQRRTQAGDGRLAERAALDSFPG